ncbi:MAG TPA: hypothetical protein VMU39_21660 [Solirubrobacteraceae bacterium]|nr:hypothetical protein [Solirubrobacteraceae bacterium]
MAWPTIWHELEWDAGADGATANALADTVTRAGSKRPGAVALMTEQPPARALLWGGAAQGIMGTHEWLFERTGEGVRVITSESFAGDPVEADTAGLQSVLDNSLSAWLSRMKARAESTG